MRDKNKKLGDSRDCRFGRIIPERKDSLSENLTNVSEGEGEIKKETLREIYGGEMSNSNMSE